MNLNSFKRNQIIGWAAPILFLGLALFITGFITIPAIQWQVSSPEERLTLRDVPLSDGWTWSQIILIHLLLLGPFGYLAWEAIVQMLTKFSDDSIEQPSFTGKKVIRWHEVRSIRNITTANIEIYSSSSKITLNPNIYLHSAALDNELRLRVPQTIFPTNEQIKQEQEKHKKNAETRLALGAIFTGIFLLAIGKGLIGSIVGLLLVGYGLYKLWYRITQ